MIFLFLAHLQWDILDTTFLAVVVVLVFAVFRADVRLLKMFYAHALYGLDRTTKIPKFV